jgi:hypothetical protein
MLSRRKEGKGGKEEENAQYSFLRRPSTSAIVHTAFMLLILSPACAFALPLVQEAGCSKDMEERSARTEFRELGCPEAEAVGSGWCESAHNGTQVVARWWSWIVG